MTRRPVLGIDIGGTGIKGALVNLEIGKLASHRLRIPTPAHSTPEAVCEVLDEIVTGFADDVGKDPVGIAFPGVVQHGVTRTAANVDASWIDLGAEQLFSDRLKREVSLINDADAAGIAEAQYGAAKNIDGLVILTTLGTGIGTALIYNGVVIPNCELGHIEIDGKDAETQASASARETAGLSMEDWIARLQRYYDTLEKLLSPDLIIVGGGVSKNSDEFLPKLTLRTPIIPAVLRNKAGMIGAAWAAEQRFGKAK